MLVYPSRSNKMRIGDRRADEASLVAAAYEVSVRLPNEILRSLSLTPFWEGVKYASEDEIWWFRRTEYLVKRELTYRTDIDPRCWSRVYLSLARYGLEFNPRHDYGSTLLIRVLLDIGADPTGYATIFAIVRHATPEGLSLLLADPRLVIEADDGYALAAIESDNVDKLRLILEDGRDNPQYQRCLAMRTAASNGQTEMVRLLLADKRVVASSNDNEAIMYAVKFGYNDIFDLLFEDKSVRECAGSHQIDGYRLENAITTRNLHIVSRILPTLSPSGIAWPLILAAKIGDAQIVNAILQAQHDVGYVAKNIIEEAVAVAKRRRHIDVVSLLEQEIKARMK